MSVYRTIGPLVLNSYGIIHSYTKVGSVNRGLCLLYKNVQCTSFQLTSILHTHDLGIHTKFQKNTPKNKISVHNTKLHADPAHAVRQLHVLTVYSFIQVRSVWCETQAMFVPTFETCH